MAKAEFKKAVQADKPLVQAKSNLMADEGNTKAQTELTKTWNDYEKNIKAQQENAEQVILSVATEPDLKEALNKAGKNVGRRNGGTKSVVREALSEYFKKHPELL